MMARYVVINTTSAQIGFGNRHLEKDQSRYF